MNIELSTMSGARVLCALSGGADSVCLVHYLHTHGIDTVAAHFEHGIRGEESERDMRFCESFCKERSIPFVCGRGDVPAWARANGMGLEEAARKLRYEFLQQKAEELHCRYIATAHNADDNAETMLFNLCRGSGAKGLAGIPPVRGNIIRPLLKVTRSGIEQYLEENSLPHVEDSSNASDDYTRNLIRHRIMPVLRDINPRVAEAAGRTAELCSRDEDCLSSMAADFIGLHLRDGSLPAAALSKLHPALSSRVLRSLLPGLHMEHVDTVLAFLAEPGYGELSLPGHRLVRDSGRLLIDPVRAEAIAEAVISPGQELLLPGAKLKISCEICTYAGEVNDLFKTSYLKYEIIEGDIRAGSRREGDSIRPLGRGCRKKLKELFMERRLTQNERLCCPVLRDNKGPLLVYGLAMDERAKPEKGEKALKIIFTRL